jgi:hypothetical protein
LSKVVLRNMVAPLPKHENTWGAHYPCMGPSYLGYEAS